MKRKRGLRVAAYLLYCLVIAGILLVWKFPYQALERKLERLARRHLGLEVEITRLAPKFPPGVKFSRCRIQIPGYRSRQSLELEKGQVALRFIPLLRGRLAMGAQARAYGGSLRGQFKIEPFHKPDHFAMKMEWRELELERYRGASDLLGRQIAGQTSGELHLKGDLASPDRSTGSAELRLNNGSIPVYSPYLKVNNLEELELAASVKLGARNLEISQCQFRARGLQGRVSGILKLRPSLFQSELQMTGEGRLDATLLKNPDTANWVRLFQMQKTSIPFQLGGTLAEPWLQPL